MPPRGKPVQVEIICIVEPAGGILDPPGYATSVAVSRDRWFLRAANGCTWGGHDSVGRRGEVNWERVTGYQKTGDSFQSVTSLGVSADGFRLLAGWKRDDHGCLIVRNRWAGDHSGPNGQILGEFGGARTLGGVAVAVKNGRYYGFSLSQHALTQADITTPPKLAPGIRQPSVTIPGTPGGTGLVASGDTVAYLTTAGELVTYTPGGSPCITSESAVCLGMEGTGIVLGKAQGMTGPDGRYFHLGGFPSAVALLQGVPYAWVGPVLYREDVAIFSMPSGIGTVVDCKGFRDRLYCATTDRLVVVRVGP